MKQVNLRKTVVSLWEDIDEAPVQNYNFMNEYAMLDMNIGNSPEDVNKRLERLSLFIAHRKWQEVEQEHRNLYQTMYNMALHVNFKSLQFAVMIHSINGKRVEDYSQDNLTRIICDLSNKGLTMGVVKDTIISIKKKLLAS